MPTLPRPQTDDPADVRRAVALAFDMVEKAEPWREIGATEQPAFSNSWANVGGGAQTCAFRKNVLGQIEFRGYITSPAGGATGNNTVAFTLPSGYAPTGEQRLTVSGISGASAILPGWAIIATTGTVTIRVAVANNVVVDNVNLNGFIRP